MGLVKKKAPSNAVATRSTTELPLLVPCPRKHYVTGHQDWLTLSGSHGSNFDVGPICYEQCIAPTRYAHFFCKGPPKPENVSTCCDFGKYWVRIAWQYAWRAKHIDLSLLPVAASMYSANPQDGACPTDPSSPIRPKAVRRWFTIRDPGTGDLLDDFTICSDCVSCLGTITPPLKNVFVPAAPEPCQATCDLTGEGRRSHIYFEHLFDVAIAFQQQRCQPGTSRLAAFIKLVASVPECQRRHNNTAMPVYGIISVPGFAICPDCYQDAVKANVDREELPLTHHIVPRDFTSYVCDFYSPRMRQIWENCNRSNDPGSFTKLCQERNGKLAEIDPRLGILVKQRDTLKAQMDLHSRVSASMQQGARIAQIGAMGGGPFGLAMNPRFVVCQVLLWIRCGPDRAGFLGGLLRC
ncbi:ser arg-related nuclear matrix protein [Teratosphaeria destructans]|uniref:Ser arg-related nuclear matrix protein n=1 Tax=Teratosphaeria destructans TaxID=418781 RepID=A0A9W7SJJ6_9PEZI|nr:ser arg-related nuclear matrix protein [Teratosphaeria destructans]